MVAASLSCLSPKEEERRRITAYFAEGEKVIRAERFEAIDKSGTTRIILEGGEIPRLMIDGKDGYARISLVVLSDGTSFLSLNDDNGPRAVLGSTTLTGSLRPTSSLVLFDEGHKVIWKVP
jgi:hypothetical protein